MRFVHGRRRLACLLLVTALGLSACGGGDDSGDASPPADNGGEDHGGGHGGGEAAATVKLKPAVFEPDETKIKVGEAVKWEWDGGVQHNVNGEGFKSELQKKGSFTHTFDEAGTFAYKCDVHPTTMKGTVVVE